MKKILFITGTRADFGKIKNLMSQIEQSEQFELHVLVTGMRMMPLYGATFHEVKRQNYQNIYLIANQHLNEPMDAILANTISVIAKLVHTIQPDIVIEIKKCYNKMYGILTRLPKNDTSKTRIRNSLSRTC